MTESNRVIMDLIRDLEVSFEQFKEYQAFVPSQDKGKKEFLNKLIDRDIKVYWVEQVWREYEGDKTNYFILHAFDMQEGEMVKIETSSWEVKKVMAHMAALQVFPVVLRATSVPHPKNKKWSMFSVLITHATIGGRMVEIDALPF